MRASKRLIISLQVLFYNTVANEKTASQARGSLFCAIDDEILLDSCGAVELIGAGVETAHNFVAGVIL